MTLRIYFSEHSDPVIADTLDGLNALAARLSAFLDSDDQRIIVPADTTSSPLPYTALLPTITFQKGNGPILVTLSVSSGVHVSGSLANLKTWCRHFGFPSTATDGDHHHPDQVQLPQYVAAHSACPIIEVRE